MSRPGFSFSHFGMFVTDIARLEDFYTRILEFTVTDRGELPGPHGPMDLVFLSRDPDEHHQIVIITGRPADMAFNPINQISLKADSLATLRAMHQTLLREGAAAGVPLGDQTRLAGQAAEQQRLLRASLAAADHIEVRGRRLAQLSTFGRRLAEQQHQQSTEGCDGVRNTFDHLY